MAKLDSFPDQSPSDHFTNYTDTLTESIVRRAAAEVDRNIVQLMGMAGKAEGFTLPEVREQPDASFRLDQFLWYHSLTRTTQRKLIETLEAESRVREQHAARNAAEHPSRLLYSLVDAVEQAMPRRGTQKDAVHLENVLGLAVEYLKSCRAPTAEPVPSAVPEAALEQRCPSCQVFCVRVPLPGFGRGYRCLNCGWDNLPRTNQSGLPRLP